MLFSLKRHSRRCMKLCFLVGMVILIIISCYAHQTGFSTEEKYAFYDKVVSIVAVVPDDEILLLGVHLNLACLCVLVRAELFRCARIKKED